MSTYNFWKWSTEEDVPKSKRNKENNNLVFPNTNEMFQKDTEKKALPGFVDFKTIHIEPSNKRTENSERMSGRHMIIQTRINPFMTESNYIDDIKTQDTLLRPKDSNTKDSTVETTINDSAL